MEITGTKWILGGTHLHRNEISTKEVTATIQLRGSEKESTQIHQNKDKWIYKWSREGGKGFLGYLNPPFNPSGISSKEPRQAQELTKPRHPSCSSGWKWWTLYEIQHFAGSPHRKSEKDNFFSSFPVEEIIDKPQAIKGQERKENFRSAGPVSDYKLHADPQFLFLFPFFSFQIMEKEISFPPSRTYDYSPRTKDPQLVNFWSPTAKLLLLLLAPKLGDFLQINCIKLMTIFTPGSQRMWRAWVLSESHFQDSPFFACPLASFVTFWVLLFSSEDRFILPICLIFSSPYY